MAMFWIPADATPAPTPLEPTVWLPDVQMLAVRESSDPQGGGLYLAVRAATTPRATITMMSGTSSSIWTASPGSLMSAARPTPRRRSAAGGTTSGSPEAPRTTPPWWAASSRRGRERRATGVTFSEEGSTVRLVMGLEQAYPQSAGSCRFDARWSSRGRRRSGCGWPIGSRLRVRGAERAVLRRTACRSGSARDASR